MFFAKLSLTFVLMMFTFYDVNLIDFLYKDKGCAGLH